ncbi:ECF RNA polymerase sigma factor SigK [Dyella sp. AD56]|uniref:sigma-70 family RNA polymerase sigma factor n=1 Tax=Dyella sp. AD56 TaxID=1528744 RepID=UPI000CAB3117|nr:ECF RNA polymerase sigma factor SigK [Dyella sp. AD56]
MLKQVLLSPGQPKPARQGTSMSQFADERDELSQVLTQVAAGDQGAFAELYRRTAAKLFGVCLRMLADHGEAEEVLQEIYTTVWRRAESFDAKRASAMTWLMALARNKVIDRLRQRHEHLPSHSVDLDDLVDEQPGPATQAEATEEHRRLRECLDALEPKQRQSVREAFFSGSTYSELAERCHVPLGTMKSWIRRGLLQLRTCLDA